MVKKFGATPRATPAKADELVAPLLFALEGSNRVLVGTMPKQATWQRCMLSLRANVPVERQSAALTDFLRGCLADPEDLLHFEDRLGNPADQLDTPDLFPVVTWLAQEWVSQSKDETLKAHYWEQYHAFLADKAGTTQAVREQPADDVEVTVDPQQVIDAPAGPELG